MLKLNFCKNIAKIQVLQKYIVLKQWTWIAASIQALPKLAAEKTYH
ncbi:hypothetical protein [Galactobacillus timonensis]|nr:hypothetical protein [Galactobacillus timonensis]